VRVKEVFSKIPWVNVIKLISVIAGTEGKEARVFVNGKPFQASFTFVNKARAYFLPCLICSINQDWKDLPDAKTPAYLVSTSEKSFLRLTPGIRTNNVGVRINLSLQDQAERWIKMKMMNLVIITSFFDYFLVQCITLSYN